jgi:hypothetical protein
MFLTTMPNRSTDSLFQLIKSLKKSEKRNFKLYVTRNSGSADLKIIHLFDALDKMKEYDEAVLLQRNKELMKQQLSNLKAHLYREILSSLRLIKDDNIDMELHEQMDHARILYNKGLYHQSLRILERMKEQARHYNQFTYLQQVLFFEKKIESLFITRSMKDRAAQLVEEGNEAAKQLAVVNVLSNLALQLYSWYIEHGHARNKSDQDLVQQFLLSHLPTQPDKQAGFYERLYLYQCYCWTAFIRLDFLQYYRYTQKWVELFRSSPWMMEAETGHYIKGMHNLMGAHFDLGNYESLAQTIAVFEAFENTPLVQNNDNNRIQVFVYLHVSKINLCFLKGTFTEGLALVPFIESKLEEYELYLDRHRVLIFYYKIACLYFGSGNNDKAIDYLNKIINLKVDLRSDLQCYARLLHLIAHYELGNFQLLEYLTKSVYRFMFKMQSLSLVEEKVFDFLRMALRSSADMLQEAFERLLEELRPLEFNRFETRAFIYLDIISWLESKIQKRPVQDIIAAKYKHRKERKH